MLKLGMDKVNKLTKNSKSSYSLGKFNIQRDGEDSDGMWSGFDTSVIQSASDDGYHNTFYLLRDAKAYVLGLDQ